VQPAERSWKLTLAAVGALAVLAVLSLISVLPPAPAPTDAPADEFSARRAFEHVTTIGQTVHVTGSPAAGDVRQYLVDTLTGLGLKPELQQAVGATGALGETYALANVTNVIATLPGTGTGTGTGTGSGPASSATLFLVAHYDSVQVSYGANDDGAGVSTLLETLRALTSGPALKNDVVVIFTDAEEACLCGAEAFVHEHPLGKAGGVVLNVESRGASGPAIMFETARGNAALIGHYAKVPYPVGTSMAVEVYRLLPNDTDFTPFRESGRFTGLNAAYLDGSAVYHSPQDRPEYLSLRSLQHHGANVLALVRDLGNAEPAELAALARPGAHDATYFPVLGSLWRYPGWLVWPVAILAALAVLGLAVEAGRRGLGGRRRLLGAFGQVLLLVLVTVVAAYLFWVVLVALRPGYAQMADPWRPWWFRLGLMSLVAALFLAWFAVLRPRFGTLVLWIGSLAFLAVLGLVLAFATPGGSYLVALPALAAALAGLAALGLPDLKVEGEGPELFLHTVAAALAVVVLAPMVLLFLPALGLATGSAAALFAVLLGTALLPVLDRVVPLGRRAGAPALVALVLALGSTAIGFAVDQFDARHPLPTQLTYALDADTGRAWWVSEEASPGDWTGQYVVRDVFEDLSDRFPMLEYAQTTGPAEPAELAAPGVTVISDSVRPTTGEGGAGPALRRVHLVVRPQRKVRLVGVAAPGTVVERAVVGGRVVPLKDGALDVVFHAPSAAGVDVVLTLRDNQPLRLRVTDGSDGLSGLPGFVPRPSGVGIEGTHTSELVMVGTTLTL
jgi:hypothetical protein